MALIGTTSALGQAEQAFAMLVCEPSPILFDARCVEGLPDEPLPLEELRRLVLKGRLNSTVTDGIWRQLALQARSWGPGWVVAAIGVALPGLTRMAAALTRAHPGCADEIDSELLTAFLNEVRHADLAKPRLWQRWCWTAWRAALGTVRVEDTESMPAEFASGSRTPLRPYGHPDLVLGRAVAAGVLTAAQAELISATRLGDALIDELAAVEGVTASVLRMRRRRAERRLASAIAAGDVTGPGAAMCAASRASTASAGHGAAAVRSGQVASGPRRVRAA
ncbi:hypothetical protein [Catellatospora chokoriensis]|uniref:DNA-directed RNA polymerase specialized sigma24 family protein n=1 Tax=Catellatospora chokoriensis TaxID=310353 RepID=A0A8J3JRK5_9ACTN|nr:hypothetical protein [Catellatospora chokoriensis]GIF89811.1 hypothetical protein Cch02nite_32550 [Catellatospora chokoriensis]